MASDTSLAGRAPGKAHHRCMFVGCEQTDGEAVMVSIGRKHREEILRRPGRWGPRELDPEAWEGVMRPKRVKVCQSHLTTAALETKLRSTRPYVADDFNPAGQHRRRSLVRVSSPSATTRTPVSMEPAYHTAQTQTEDDLLCDSIPPLQPPPPPPPPPLLQPSCPRRVLPAVPCLVDLSDDESTLFHVGVRSSILKGVQYLVQACGFDAEWSACGDGAKAFTPRQALLLVLMRCRRAYPLFFISQLLGVRTSKSTLSKSWRRAIVLIAAIFKQRILQPWSDDKADAERNPIFQGAFERVRFIGDASATPLAIDNGPKENRLFYSSYYRGCVVKWMVLMNPSGVLEHVSEAYAGSTSDTLILKHMGVPDLLSDGKVIMYDKGAPGLRKFLRPKTSMLTPTFLHDGQLTEAELHLRLTPVQSVNGADMWSV